jgi:hypothetical protein
MNNPNEKAEGKEDLQPGETRDTTVEKTTPGQPEKKEVERTHEEGPAK